MVWLGDLKQGVDQLVGTIYRVFFYIFMYLSEYLHRIGTYILE